jgi:phospholipid N-methyltransferase
MGTITFFVESLKQFKTVGAVIPTSRASARKMTTPVDFSRAKFIVELGGGTGAITKAILANMRQDAELVVFEITPSFAQALKDLHDPRLTVIQDSAVKLGDYLASRGIQKADYIISTLPLAVMESTVVARVLEEVHTALDERGRYIQIQYSLISKKDIKKKFSKVTIDFTLFNFPPAFFYICER